MGDWWGLEVDEYSSDDEDEDEVSVNELLCDDEESSDIEGLGMLRWDEDSSSNDCKSNARSRARGRSGNEGVWDNELVGEIQQIRWLKITPVSSEVEGGVLDVVVGVLDLAVGLSVCIILQWGNSIIWEQSPSNKMGWELR